VALLHSLPGYSRRSVLPTRSGWPVPGLHAATRFGLSGTWIGNDSRLVWIDRSHSCI